MASQDEKGKRGRWTQLYIDFYSQDEGPRGFEGSQVVGPDQKGEIQGVDRYKDVKMAECIWGNSRIYLENEHVRVPFFAIHVIM